MACANKRRAAPFARLQIKERATVLYCCVAVLPALQDGSFPELPSFFALASKTKSIARIRNSRI
jgi:hypothetical protein